MINNNLMFVKDRVTKALLLSVKEERLILRNYEYEFLKAYCLLGDILCDKFPTPMERRAFLKEFIPQFKMCTLHYLMEHAFHIKTVVRFLKEDWI